MFKVVPPRESRGGGEGDTDRTREWGTEKAHFIEVKQLLVNHLFSSWPTRLKIPTEPKKKKKKNALYVSVNVFSTKVLFGDTIFYVSNWRRDRHFTWSSEPHEGLACYSAKGVASFLGYFKTLSIGSAPGIEPATSRSAVNTLYPLS